MKRLIYYFSEIKTNLLMDIFLIAIITYSLIQLNDGIGNYRFYNESRRLVMNCMDIENDVYYMEISNSLDISDETQQEFIDRMEFVDKLKSMEGVEAVIGKFGFNQAYNDIVNGTMIASQYLMQLFPEVNEGKWPDEIYDSDGNMNAVICGDGWNDVGIGDYLELSNKRKIKVVGRLYNPMLAPTMSADGTFMTTMDIIGTTRGLIVLPECDEAMNMYEQSGMSKWDTLSYRNFFVKFKSEALQEQIDAVKSILESRGRMLKLDEILENTTASTTITIRKRMVKPIFYVIIAGFIFICMSAIYIMRGIRKNAVTYLLGESKIGIICNIIRRIMFMLLISIGIGVIHIIKCIIDIKNQVEFTPGSEMLCDSTSVWILCIIGVVMLIINIAISIIVLNNNSPIEFWNKVRE